MDEKAWSEVMERNSRGWNMCCTVGVGRLCWQQAQLEMSYVHFIEYSLMHSFFFWGGENTFTIVVVEVIGLKD